MKKLITALLIAAIVPAFAACSVSVDTDSDIDTDTKSSVSSVEKEDEKDNAEDEAEEATEDEAEDKAEEKADDKAEESDKDEKKSDDKTSTISTDGVDPELVKAMDEYAVFIDEFIEFMTPYKDLDTETADEAVVSEFFTAYMTFISEQEANLTAFTEIKPDELEGKDKEYYENISAEFEQKLKDAGLEEQAGI